MNNIAKKFSSNILAISLSVLYNYFEFNKIIILIYIRLKF